MKPHKIAVVVPYFQREPGILSRALATIANQEYPKHSLYVLLVDDGSPLSAEDELRNNPPHQDLRIISIRQENSGPGAARNTGLANLEPDTDIVAFLDSDDEWSNDHLRRASICVFSGYTAYFSNLYHVGVKEDDFTRYPRIDWTNHRIVNNDQTIRAYEGDMINQIATANILMLSAFAISVPQLGAVRFPEGFKHGGEDYLYWMELVQHGARFAYSILPELRRGAGVNIWDSNGWGTDGLAKRTLDEARYLKRALEKYAHKKATRADIRRRIARLQIVCISDVIHRFRRNKHIDWRTVRCMALEVPLSFTTALFLMRTVKQRLWSALS